MAGDIIRNRNESTIGPDEVRKRLSRKYPVIDDLLKKDDAWVESEGQKYCLFDVTIALFVQKKGNMRQRVYGTLYRFIKAKKAEEMPLIKLPGAQDPKAGFIPQSTLLEFLDYVDRGGGAIKTRPVSLKISSAQQYGTLEYLPDQNSDSENMEGKIGRGIVSSVASDSLLRSPDNYDSMLQILIEESPRFEKLWNNPKFWGKADLGDGAETEFTPAVNLASLFGYEMGRKETSERVLTNLGGELFEPLWKKVYPGQPLFIELEDREGLYIPRLSLVRIFYLSNKALSLVGVDSAFLEQNQASFEKF